MSDIKLEFPYKRRWTDILGGLAALVFFGLLAVFARRLAANNDRGLIIGHVIELGPDGATIFWWAFYWVIAAFFFLGAAGGVLVAYHRLMYRRQRLVFGRAALVVPRTWSRQEKVIAYRDIRALSTLKRKYASWLYIKHLGGNHVIISSCLPSEAAFEQVRGLLAEKAREHAPIAHHGSRSPPPPN